MNLYYLVLFLFLLHLPTNFCRVCHLVLSSDTETFSDNLNDVNSDCEIEILPHPKLSIRLSVFSMYSFKVWQTIFLKDGNDTITRGSFITQAETVITAQPTTGLILKWGFDRGSWNYWVSSRIHVQRYNETVPQCSQIEQTVGNKIKHIQHSELKTVSKECVYFLKPETDANETLFLFFNDGEENKLYSVDKNSQAELRPHSLTVDAWKSKTLLSIFNSKHPGEIAQIAVVSLKNTCSCGTRRHKFSSNNTQLLIQTPSMSLFTCPDMICSVAIDMDLEYTLDDMVPRYLVSTESVSPDGIAFEFDSKKSEFTMQGMFPNSLLIDTEPVILTYITPNSYSKGSVKMNITSIWIPKKCDCTTFFEKKYDRPHSLKIKIPEQCEMMFCHWYAKIPDAIQTDNAYLVRVYLNGVGPDDRVEVAGMNIDQRYNKEQLKWPRVLHINDSANASILFWRKQKGPEATLEVSWDIVKISEPATSTTFNLTTQPITIVSPLYPYLHENYLNLVYVFNAPENHTIDIHIDDLDVEQVHDFLTIHDGPFENSTELEHLTGGHENLTVKSTGNNLFVKFVSDGHHSGKGFHFNAFAVPKKNSPEELRPQSPGLFKKPTFSHTLLVFLLTVLIVLSVVGWYFRDHECLMFTRFRNGGSSFASFHRHEDSTSVSLSA